MSNKDKPNEDGDLALVGPPDEEGVRPVLRRHSNDSWSGGRIIPLKEGKPILGELVTLTEREGGGFTMKPMLNNDEPVKVETTKDGPAMVNSQVFRNGWDNIFGQKVVTGEA